MCGRYSLTSPAEVLVSELDLVAAPREHSARYNIAPGGDIAVVPNRDDRRIEMFRWGLIPWWAKDPAIGHRMINARAESAAEKRSFAEPLQRRRCLIPADGFYEWQGESSPKTPFYVRRKDGRPFAFAGLWDRWRPAEGAPVHSCTILTTQPNELLAPIHDRMPVILPRAAYAAWLDPRPRESAELAVLLRPYRAEELEAYEVSKAVNKPENDGPACVARIAGGSA